jgi:hypothetical protein
MQETRWHIQMPEVVVVEEKSLLRAERRRFLPNVDEHVMDGAVGAAHQLGLTAPRAAVHTADHPLRRTRLGVLHERSGQPRHAEMIVENGGVEGPGKQAAVITEWLWDKDENVCKLGLFDAHVDMLP